MKAFILPSLTILSLLLSCKADLTLPAGATQITKWPADKRAAISITYDDGTINQFTVARPIMNKLGFRATYFIITGKIKGSAKGKFIGRSPEQIVKETATIKTNADNLFERASLIAYTGLKNGVDFHTRAGIFYEAGKVEEAYKIIDTGFQLVRGLKLNHHNEQIFHDNPSDTTTWEDYKSYAAEGHEIASHTVTHPKLAVLDSVNLAYELNQSKTDIINNLGDQYAFSAECPYGTENERVMHYAHQVYPALRNRMPASYLAEINRSGKKLPYEFNTEYIQWQRGPVRSVSMSTMKSWVDTCLTHDNIWLVLVFHGVDGIGWEPRTGNELNEYFTYMKQYESNLWIAPFGEVTKYIRERISVKRGSRLLGDTIAIDFTSNLSPADYHVPLTLKTYIDKSWSQAILHRLNHSPENETLKINQDIYGHYVMYTALPSDRDIRIYPH
jgi:peptidoglycan/xylan/chitin deacetylase (PgdA/CDA1 family)